MKGILVVLVSAACSLAMAREARGDDADAKYACAADHERTQRLRLIEKLREARGAALACAQDACPAIVRVECARLLSELDAVVPSIVVEVRDAAGNRALDCALELDGVSLGKVDDRSIAVDPGEHVLRIATPDGRTSSQSFVVREGELRRAVIVGLPRAVEGPMRAPETVLGAPSGETEAPRSTPWPVFVVGGLGLAALGSFAFFGLRGYREEVSLESSCAPRCAPGNDDAMRRDYLVADIALGVGVLSLVAATWLYVAREVRGSSTRRPAVQARER